MCDSCLKIIRDDQLARRIQLERKSSCKTTYQAIRSINLAWTRTIWQESDFLQMAFGLACNMHWSVILPALAVQVYLLRLCDIISSYVGRAGWSLLIGLRGIVLSILHGCLPCRTNGYLEVQDIVLLITIMMWDIVRPRSSKLSPPFSLFLFFSIQRSFSIYV